MPPPSKELSTHKDALARVFFALGNDDGPAYPISMDSATFALKTIAYPHAEIHEGQHFVCRDFVDLSINNVFDIQLTTPDTARWAHMDFLFACESETIFWVYENVTVLTAGTLVFCGNRDRNSANTAGTTGGVYTSASEAVAATVTSTVGSTRLAAGIIGSGRQEGGTATSRQEVIFKQNTNYLVRFFATAAGYTNYQLDHYEHANKV